MTAAIIRFPIHPVRVVPTDDGWLVEWRGWGWLHATKTAALADAQTIATAHGERVLDCSDQSGGQA
jgi:hypothetical protein